MDPSVEASREPGAAGEPGRPWAQGIGLLLLGLVVAALANVLALGGDHGPAVRTLGVLGYGGGLTVSGAGVHRLLWVGSPRRARWVRLLVTAFVTPPVFAATGVLLGLLMTVFQLRFAS
jgi:hypothetical protein